MQLNQSQINNLAKKREGPYEVMFKLSDAQQDPTKLNKYWFDFPSQWADQYDKDAIIGIRDIYLTKTNRLIMFDFHIFVNEETQNDQTKIWLHRKGTVIFTMDGEDTMKAFTSKFNQKWFNQTKTVSSDTASNYSSLSANGETYDWNEYDFTSWFTSWFNYDDNTKQCILHIGCSHLCPETVTVTDTSNQTHTCYFGIGLKALNNDTKAVLHVNVDEIYHDDLISIPIWTRYAVYVTSSLAEDDANGFLGHSRTLGFTPIKYYRLKNKNKKFWIELYETRYHDVPVTVLPNDNRDDLFIEAIVCFTSAAML